ncbi:MAG: MATE family efflux transporter [Actinobacteria bacterium]|nr:MATE family efflux transporter [Actinomycetota bacterium]MBM3712205.1 MATE family efflux transporter [Actinomycetota bacterium]
MEKERQQILNDNLRTLLFKFSYPSIVALVLGALYNMVDTIFVGKGVGPLAIAGLTIVLPIQIIMWAIGFMIGVGSGSIISRNLGAGNRQIAVNAAGNAIIINLVLSIALMIPSYLFLDKMLPFFGASADVLPYARDYASIVLMGFVFYSFDAMSRIIIRAEGKPRAAMYPTIFGATLNMILDPIFIFVFKMGVKGAAIATVISQTIAVLYILVFFVSGRSIFRFKVSNFKINPKLVWETIKIGAPSFLMATIDSFIILLFNRAVLKYGNDMYIAVVGIGIRIIDLTLMPLIGITQGFSTIVGFNYGAKLYNRVKKILWETALWNTIISTAVFLILMIFPTQLIGFFSKDAEFLKIGITPIRIIIAFFPALGFQFVGGTFFQAIGKALPATIITLSRQVLFLIPAILIFPLFWGLTGVWMSWPFSDFMDIIVCIIFIFLELKLINKAIKSQARIKVQTGSIKI